MNVYEKYGVQPILNLDGPLTRYGGAIMEQETLDAMDEAAKYTVPIDRLQAAASKVIARVTHAEAGIVTSGAFSGLTLATAACRNGKCNAAAASSTPWRRQTASRRATRSSTGEVAGA